MNMVAVYYRIRSKQVLLHDIVYQPPCKRLSTEHRQTYSYERLHTKRKLLLHAILT
jgi:hypothetical protein